MSAPRPALKPGATDEYLRRNLLVASATGARANVRVALDHLNQLSRRPAWLMALLEGTLHRLEELPQELADHRDELRA